jgi:hypothetical protein
MSIEKKENLVESIKNEFLEQHAKHTGTVPEVTKRLKDRFASDQDIIDEEELEGTPNVRHSFYVLSHHIY